MYSLITHPLTQGNHWVGTRGCAWVDIYVYAWVSVGDTIGIRGGYWVDYVYLSVLSVLLVTLYNILCLSFGSPTTYSLASIRKLYLVVILWITYYI